MRGKAISLVTFVLNELAHHRYRIPLHINSVQVIVVCVERIEIDRVSLAGEEGEESPGVEVVKSGVVRLGWGSPGQSW